MEKNETPKKTWTAHNGCSLSNRSTAGDTDRQEKFPVIVMENCRSVNMEESDALIGKKPDDPYGLPITASLAVSLIADFQHLLKPFTDTSEKDGSNNFFDEFFDEFFKRFFEKDFNKEYVEKIKINLKQLLYYSSAITIDKNILMKTLSQPGCEGLRFYLCKKKVEIDGKGKVPFVSLVTVGVDSVGQDLNYVYYQGKVTPDFHENSIENMSVISEYGSPPPPPKTGTKGGIDEEYEKKFVLLKYARDQVKNIKA